MFACKTGAIERGFTRVVSSLTHKQGLVGLPGGNTLALAYYKHLKITSAKRFIPFWPGSRW